MGTFVYGSRYHVVELNPVQLKLVRVLLRPPGRVSTSEHLAIPCRDHSERREIARHGSLGKAQRF